MPSHAKQQCWVKLVDGREAICDKQLRSGQADCVMVAVKDEATGKTGAFQPMKLSKISKSQMTIRAR